MGEGTVGAECQAVRDAASDYLDGHVSGDGRPRLERHLDVCPSCGSFVDDLGATLNLLADLREPLPSEAEEARAVYSYDEYFPEPDLPRGLADWTQVKQAWGKLACSSMDERRLAIESSDEYCDPLLCDWLVARARRTSYTKPVRAVPFAEAAVQIARRMRAASGDSRHLARALEALGGCATSLKDFPLASRVLDEVELLCDAPDVGAEERARYLTTRGLYHSHIGQFDEARKCLKTALELHRRRNNRRDVLCHLVNLAGTVLSAGESDRALELCDEAEALLEAEKDPPRLKLALYCNRVLALCESQLSNEARDLLPMVCELAKVVGGWFFELYAHWLEGTVSLAERRFSRAAEIFESVRTEFLARGHVVWYVEATLDLARVHLHMGQLQDLDELASELLVNCEGPQAENGVRAAVVSFAKAIKQRTLSDRVLSSIAVALSSARLCRRA